MTISAGLGGNHLTNYMLMDSSKKGYTKGQPDLELKYKMTNGYIDVLALELKNLDESHGLSDHQITYIKKLADNTIYTIVSHDFVDIKKKLNIDYTKLIPKKHKKTIND